MDPRHQTPERLARAKADKETGVRIGIAAIAVGIAFMTLWNAVPALAYGITHDLDATTTGRVLYKSTDKQFISGSRGYSYTCKSHVGYNVDGRGLSVYPALSCPEKGMRVTVAYNPDVPDEAQVVETRAMVTRLVLGGIAILVGVGAQVRWGRLLGRKSARPSV